MCIPLSSASDSLEDITGTTDEEEDLDTLGDVEDEDFVKHVHQGSIVTVLILAAFPALFIQVQLGDGVTFDLGSDD